MSDESSVFNPQPGDIVQLKSGGYQMTVCKVTNTSLDGNPRPVAVSCDWHSEKGRPCACTYLVTSLMPAIDENEST